MSTFLSESEALRACNLAATPTWREWLRRNLPSQEISTGRIYSRDAVSALHAKIRCLAGDPAPEAPEPQREAPRHATSAPIDANAAPMKNRNIDSAQLHTR